VKVGGDAIPLECSGEALPGRNTEGVEVGGDCIGTDFPHCAVAILDQVEVAASNLLDHATGFDVTGFDPEIDPRTSTAGGFSDATIS